ncbi:MAG TPA: Gfo/Idh/MocA family oxidoreductase [Gemmatimonadaceae bacterium]|jgi:predicted dehydrogenase|nr:Gfo/Idh/MocA family oxidoreductase [Gemmatimonadaceae bacterium]
MVARADAPVRWGVLGAANIAVRNVIPAMQRSARTPVIAIASRDRAKAEAAARELRIPRAYGSYEELLADPEVEAVYNPLPNHLHVPWTIRAAEAGKHVLCEKPIALSSDEARQLLAVRERTGVRIAEAFMVRNHPQWLAVREMVRAGRIGALRVVAGHFAYFKRDPHDVRSVPEWGGGGLMDVGCYPITMTRWLFGEEPEAVIGSVDRDPELRVDRVVSALMRFPSGGQATFTSGMQLVPYQRMQLHGTSGRIEVPIPFNAPNDRPTRILVDDGRELGDRSADAIEFPVVDQYTLQGDNFSAAVRGERSVVVGVEDAVGNMAVIDAIVRSAESGRWERPAR